MKALTRFSQFPAMESIRRDMDRFFDDLIPISMREGNGERLGLWTPSTDMSETDNEYLITVDLPGITKKDVEVNIQDNRLTISGDRTMEEKEDKKNYHRRERFQGRFMRSFTLPAAVKEDKIKARFKDGVLTVTVPKAEVKKAKTVMIE